MNGVMDATYWPEPVVAADERRRLYLDYCASTAPGNRNGFFSQIARLELGRGPLEEALFYEAMERIDRREDCSDFSIAGLLRILYKYRSSPLISPKLLADIEACVLRFKYWWDEPGDDYMCYFTENHQIIFHADELLVGQMYRDHIFSNTGKNGQAHIDHALPFIHRWLGWRAKFGFSEWLSNCYIDEDLLGLVNIYDFAEDAALRRWAGMFIDMLLFEMALHSYRGVLGCTHGRTYPPFIKGGRREATGSTSALMLGVGSFNSPSSLGAVPLATSAYRCPPLIPAIAADTPERMLIHERHSLNAEDTPRYGFDFNRLTDGMFYWSIQTYYHPDVVALSKRMSELYKAGRPVFPEDVYDEYIARYEAEKKRYGHVLDSDVDKTAMIAVNIETFKTPDYMLSCAQDYRPGKRGYQQHPWQATLDIDAMVFTNHPGALDESGASRPNFWAGDAILPRAVQHEYVLVCIHHVPATDPFPYSHAYFPRAAFDEVVERGNWLCGRKGNGFIALYSQHELTRPSEGEYQNTEHRVASPDNIWLCELGNRARWGDFDHFVQAITSSKVACQGLQVRYESPSQGLVEYGWEGPMRVKGVEVPVRGYKRLDNPYCQAEFPTEHYTIQRGSETRTLDFVGAEIGG